MYDIRRLSIQQQSNQIYYTKICTSVIELQALGPSIMHYAYEVKMERRVVGFQGLQMLLIGGKHFRYWEFHITIILIMSMENYQWRAKDSSMWKILLASTQVKLISTRQQKFCIWKLLLICTKNEKKCYCSTKTEASKSEETNHIISYHITIHKFTALYIHRPISHNIQFTLTDPFSFSR